MEWLLAISRARKTHNARIARTSQESPRTPQEAKIASSGRRAVLHRCCQALSTFLTCFVVVARVRPLEINARRLQNRPQRLQNRPSEAPKSSQDRPRGSRSGPRASQERPRAPKSVPRASQERPRASQERPNSAKSGLHRLKGVVNGCKWL